MNTYIRCQPIALVHQQNQIRIQARQIDQHFDLIIQSVYSGYHEQAAKVF